MGILLYGNRSCLRVLNPYKWAITGNQHMRPLKTLSNLKYLKGGVKSISIGGWSRPFE